MLKILILCCIVLMNIGDNTMEQSSKKRSGTVAGMKDGLKKATTDMLVLFLLRQKPMYVSRPGCSVVKWTGGFVGRSRTRMSGGRGE